MTCGCGEDRLSPVVAVVLVFAPGLARPYPLIPAEKYAHCIACNSIFEFVVKATEAHPQTREAIVGPWTRAVVIYDDGEGATVQPCRPEGARA